MKSSFWSRNRLKGATRPEAIFTEAETLPELKERVRDAVRCHFDEKLFPSAMTAGDPEPPVKTCLPNVRTR
jgi:hypothetical protein